jgi:hypothetical protein
MSEREYGDSSSSTSSAWQVRQQRPRAPFADGRRSAFDGSNCRWLTSVTARGEAKELTGSLYRAVEPRNRFIDPPNGTTTSLLRGDRFARLNGVLIHDIDLTKQTTVVLRHDGKPAPAIKDRPRRGHIGFQELSRDDAHVQIRNAFIGVHD